MKTNWPTKKIEDVCEFQNGLWAGKKPPYKKINVLRNTNFKNNDGSLNFDDVAEIEVERKQLEKRLLQPDDIILERSGGGPTQPVGRVVFFDREGEFSFSNFTSRLRVLDSEVLLPKFLHWFLMLQYISGKTENLQKQTTGIRNLIFADYKQIEIPIPPLEEQKQIVKVLEEKLGKVKEAIQLRQDAIADTEKILSAKLTEVFNGCGDWYETTLGELYEITSSKRVFKSEWTDEGVPFYRAREIVSLAKGEEFRTPIYISEEMYELYSDKYGVPKMGDILMTGVGTLGISYLVSKADKFYFKDGNIIWLKKNSEVNSRFVQYFLKSPQMKTQIESRAGGATVKTFTIRTAKDSQIRVPDLKTQEKIVKELDELSARIAELRALQDMQLANLKSLERAYLHEAFNGELV